MLGIMRTTLNIDDDLLTAAKALAAAQNRSLGDLVSDILRRSLSSSRAQRGKSRNGIPTFPVRTGANPVTPEIVNRLLEETE